MVGWWDTLPNQNTILTNIKCYYFTGYGEKIKFNKNESVLPTKIIEIFFAPTEYFFSSYKL